MLVHGQAGVVYVIVLNPYTLSYTDSAYYMITNGVHLAGVCHRAHKQPVLHVQQAS